MKYYVVADVHGYYTPMKKALKNAGFFEETAPCMLVICGDLLDRGREARAVIDFALEEMEKGRLIYVRGNHEDLLVQCMQEIARGGVHEVASGMSHHYLNGTWDTLLQISGMGEFEAYNAPEEMIRRVRSTPFYKKLLATCVDYHETPHYVFTHGWLPCLEQRRGTGVAYTYDPKWRDASVSAWSRARWKNGMELACKCGVREKGKTVVCGHWHASYGHAHIARSCSEWGEGANFSPFRAEGILAIDACTARSGIVNCVVIED